MRDVMLKPSVLLFLTTLLFIGQAAFAEAWSDDLTDPHPRAKRPMKIHRVEAVGLEIWTEYAPAWVTDVKYRGAKATFVAQSPRHYPPVSG